METSIIGKSVTRIDALEKVTGKAKFCSDFNIPGMLHAKVLRSLYPHARIVGIDTTKAEKLPGVRAVVTGKDSPPASIGLYVTDQYALPRDNVVRTVGDPVAAVAADTIEIAEESLNLIDVDYQELPAVFDPEDAMAKNPAVVIHPDFLNYSALGEVPWRPDPERPNVCRTFKLRTGDVEKGFQEADLIVENRFTTARIQHCPLESHRAVAWWETDGSLTVRTSSQVVHLFKPMLCRLFNLPTSKVRLLTSYIGGGFGGKAYAMVEPIVALLAQKSGRSVSLVFTRDEMFAFGRHRIPMIFYIKDGVKRDGTLVSREIKAVLALGAYSDVGVLMIGRTVAGATGTYRLPNLKVDSYGVYTNEPITGPFRGFGSPEIHWAIEQQMDIIAEQLGIDPVALRKKNILNEWERDAGGQITHSIGQNQCLDKVTEWIGWSEKLEVGEGPWRRGKGVAIGSKSAMAGTPSAAIVKVWPDGVIEVRHSGAELGQGLNTTLAQLVAEDFGVTLEQVKIVTGDSDFCGYDFGTVSMRGLFYNGNAVLLACQDAKSRLFEVAAPKLETAPEELATRGGNIYVKSAPERSVKITDLFTRTGIPLVGGEIIGTGSFTVPSIPQDPQTGRSERYVAFFSHGAYAVEVEVNIETGAVKVIKVAGAFDTGQTINPKILEGQIEGGLVMGLGSALYEKVVLDNGIVLNPNFMDYKVPIATVLPAMENMAAMTVEVPLKEGPLGAKGIGETVNVPIAPAIANAVYNAVGIRIYDLPITREKVFNAIKQA